MVVELQIKGLNKSFKIKSKKDHFFNFKTTKKDKYSHVLNNLDLTIQDKEIYCILGNNGAGKSTLLNCIGGIHIPDNGSILLKNHTKEINVIEEPKLAKKNIIFNFQDPKFDTRLSAKSNLDFHLRMYLIERETRKKLITEYLKLFNLHKKRDSKVYFLSGGQKKQLENIRGFITAKALQHEDILFLTDEPTAYCDIVAKNIIWDELENVCSHGTVLFSTNDLHEAEKLIKPKNGKIGFIKEGSIAFSGSLTDLQKKLSTKGNLNLITESKLDNILFATFCERLMDQYKSISFSTVPEECSIKIGNISQEEMNDVMAEALEFLNSNKIFIDKIEKLKPTINDLFINKGDN